MKFWEAIKATSEGHKVRLKTWVDPKAYIFMAEQCLKTHEDENWKFCSEYGGKEAREYEWEIFEEKKHRCDSTLGYQNTLQYCQEEKDGLTIFCSDGWENVFAIVDYCPFCGFTLKDKSE